MTTTTDVTIAPNDKYDGVIRGEAVTDAPETESEFREQHPAPDAADAYQETVGGAPTADDYDAEPEPEPLSWDMISPASDPDVLAKIATYFDGMGADEPTDELRAKCRLLPVDVYANAQIAAQAELRQ